MPTDLMNISEANAIALLEPMNLRPNLLDYADALMTKNTS